MLASALLLVVGYTDLVRGGITVSALALALAHCVAIPLAIMVPARSGDAAPRSAPVGDRWLAFAAGAAVFTLYCATLSPTTAFWDASEYIAAAWTFGLPHPPGNPMFVILGRAASLMPIAESVAVRVNLLAAACSAGAAGVWSLVAMRAFGTRVTPAVRRVAGAAAALMGATAFTVWHQSVVNEKVYTVALLGIATVCWCLVRWADDPDDRYLLLSAYLLGLGYANHMAGILPLPAVGLTVVMLRPRTLLSPRLLALGAMLLMVGISPLITQPIRSAHYPALNEGEPTGCRDGLKVSCTFSRETARAFTANLNREQYAKPQLSVRQAPFAAQLGMWWLYFRWQWWRDVHQEQSGLQTLLAWAFAGMAMVGAWGHWRSSRRTFVPMASLMVLLTVALIYYLNFRYGASQSPGLDVEREVRDRDYFYLWSFSAWGVWAAMGLVGICTWVAMRLTRIGVSRRLAWGGGASVLAFAVVPLIANWRFASRKDDTTAIAFARDLLNSVEPHAVLITGGDNDTFPLWYAQEVEGVRKDVTVAVLTLLNMDWFARGIIRRAAFPYEPARGPQIYRDMNPNPPSRGPLGLTIGEVGDLPHLLPVTQPLRFSVGGLDTTIYPEQQLPWGGQHVLERSDLLVLRMIADEWPKRPIYVSRTAGAYGERFGFGPHLLTQGLARKLVLNPAGVAGAVQVPGAGWIDTRRSLALWSIFGGPAAIARRNDWVDRPSLSIPVSYALAGSELAAALRAQGDTSTSLRVESDVRPVLAAARLGM
jgi:hypothetical protein